MHVSNTSELVAGICVALFGLYVTLASYRFAYVSDYGPGPGFLPLWLGIGLFALGLSLILSNLSRREPVLDTEHRSWAGCTRVLAGWSALMIAVLLLPWLGFAVSVALMTMFLILTLERRSAWTAVGVGISLALGFHFIFISALGLSLPSNPWGF
jgi:putative tricarboxylic transport membrane protein